MARGVRIEVDKAGYRELLGSSGVQGFTGSVADAVAADARAAIASSGVDSAEVRRADWPARFTTASGVVATCPGSVWHGFKKMHGAMTSALGKAR